MKRAVICLVLLMTGFGWTGGNVPCLYSESHVEENTNEVDPDENNGGLKKYWEVKTRCWNECKHYEVLVNTKTGATDYIYLGSEYSEGWIVNCYTQPQPGGINCDVCQSHPCDAEREDMSYIYIFFED